MLSAGTINEYVQKSHDIVNEYQRKHNLDFELKFVITENKECRGVLSGDSIYIGSKFPFKDKIDFYKTILHECAHRIQSEYDDRIKNPNPYDTMSLDELIEFRFGHDDRFTSIINELYKMAGINEVYKFDEVLMDTYTEDYKKHHRIKRYRSESFSRLSRIKDKFCRRLIKRLKNGTLEVYDGEYTGGGWVDP